jgi:hypothetical protein
MLIKRRSPLTGEYNERDLPVTSAQLESWLGGALIQDAMPELSADDREYIVTGFMPGEFEAMFGDIDE